MTTELPTVMACHLTKEEPRACAGFIARVGFDSVGVRIASLFGLVRVDEFSDGGADLYDTYDEMLEAHPHRGST